MEEIIGPNRNTKKCFSLLSDEKRNYLINFEIDYSNSFINIIALENNHQKEYYEYYSLEVLKNIKYLSSLDTIDDIFEEIKDKMEKKEPKLYEESHILRLVIETGHTKFKQIIFYLKEKDKNIINKFNELYIIINELKEKEKTQSQKIKLLEKKIIKLENNNNELYQKNRQFENTIEEIKTKLSKFNNNYLPRKNRKNRYKYFRTVRPVKKNTFVKKEHNNISPIKEYNKNRDSHNFFNSYQLDNSFFSNEEDYMKIKEIEQTMGNKKKLDFINSISFDEVGEDKKKEENKKKSKLAKLFDEVGEDKKKEENKKKSKLAKLLDEVGEDKKKKEKKEKTKERKKNKSKLRKSSDELEERQTIEKDISEQFSSSNSSDSSDFGDEYFEV